MVMAMVMDMVVTAMVMEATPCLGSAMVMDLVMGMAATTGQATLTMDMAAITSVMLSQAMADMAMEATPCPGSAMVTAATAGPATPIMDMAAITSVMLKLSQAMADMAMEATPCPGLAMVMGMAATATVTAATAGQATPIMDMAMVATPATAGQATPTKDMEAITSVMLSTAMEDMAMEATLGPVTAAMVMGATPMCTDLLRDLVPHKGLDTTEQETFSYFPLQLSHII